MSAYEWTFFLTYTAIQIGSWVAFHGVIAWVLVKAVRSYERRLFSRLTPEQLFTRGFEFVFNITVDNKPITPYIYSIEKQRQRTGDTE